MPGSLTLKVAGTALDAVFSYKRNQVGDITQSALSNSSYQWRGYRNELRDYVRNGLNQYTSTGPTLAYDNNGNLTGDGSWTYGYDVDNRLISASRSGLAGTLAYDANGRLRATVIADDDQSAV
jgi:YD repeat-containing protein